jgi:predicted ATPase
MISLIEALNFRCLRYIRQPMRRFNVLVGPNASGKTTFLDTVTFLGRLVSEGIEPAVSETTQNFIDLLWGRIGNSFQLAIEVQIPEERQKLLGEKLQQYSHVRYEVSIASDPVTGETIIEEEQGSLILDSDREQVQKMLFPYPDEPPTSIIGGKRATNSRKLFTKGNNDNYYSEAYPDVGRWAPSFKLGPRKSTLGNLPEDESKFPVSTWLKQLLSEGVEKIILNSQQIRKPSPPGQKIGFKPDGSNLPWVIEALYEKNPIRFREWLEHVRTALPDIEDIRTILRPEDRHRYIVLVYNGGLNVPSWTASDGTLRLLALTLPAYLDDFRGIYLIEEPENGIHPRAVEAMYQSLSSVYEAQILLATHSPVILSVVDPDDVLCFAKTPEGATDIVVGSRHPKLRDWQREENFGVLFAGGVLG